MRAVPHAPHAPPPAGWVPGLWLALSRALLQGRATLALLIGAVAAAVSFQVPNLGNLLGYDAELLAQGVHQGAGELRVRPRRSHLLPRGALWAAALARHRAVQAAVPALTLPGALAHGEELAGAPITGLDPAAPRRPFRLLRGALLDPAGDSEGVLLGDALAHRLGAAVGAAVRLTAFAGRDQPEIVGESLTVRGIVGGSFGAADAAFVDRRFLSAAGDGAASLIMVYTGQPFQAEALARRLCPEVAAPGLSCDAVRILPWGQDAPILDGIIRANRTLAVVSQSMGIAAVILPVWALLYINTLQRRREIGILGALGLLRREIFLIFLLQALLVGVVGVALGSGLGYLLLRYFQARPIFSWESFVIRPLLTSACFVRPALLVLGSVLLAAVYPAWRAARLDPGPILRRLS